MTNDEMLDSLRITRTTARDVGGTWACGTIADHYFEALIFPEHAACESYELADSRISKLWIRETATKRVVANFDRGWDIEPATDAAKAIVDLFAAGLAEHVFGI